MSCPRLPHAARPLPRVLRGGPSRVGAEARPLLAEAFTSKGFQYLTQVYLPRKLKEGDWV